MAVELAPDRIRVNAVCPVIGETALMETFMGVPDTPENRRKFEATIPLGRFSTPRDIANAVAFLASDEAAFLTGVTLEVDGGRCICPRGCRTQKGPELSFRDRKSVVSGKRGSVSVDHVGRGIFQKHTIVP